MNFYTLYFTIFVLVPTVLLASLIISISFTVLLPFKKLRNYAAHTIAKIWGRYCLFMLSIKIKKIDAHYRDKNSTYIIAVNHSTYIDSFICLSSLGGQYRIVSEADMFKVIYIGAVMRASGYIAVRRGDNTYKDVIHRIHNYIKDNISVLIFPEGRRIESEEIGKLRKGILRVSEINPEIEILPIVIGGCSRVRKIKIFKRNPHTKIYVKFLKPFSFKEVKGGDDEKLDFLKTLFQNAYDELKSIYDT